MLIIVRYFVVLCECMGMAEEVIDVFVGIVVELVVWLVVWDDQVDVLVYFLICLIVNDEIVLCEYVLSFGDVIVFCLFFLGG